jgi:hypothetical protein
MPVLAGIKVSSFAFSGPLPDISTRPLTQTMLSTHVRVARLVQRDSSHRIFSTFFMSLSNYRDCNPSLLIITLMVFLWLQMPLDEVLSTESNEKLTSRARN